MELGLFFMPVHRPENLGRLRWKKTVKRRYWLISRLP